MVYIKTLCMFVQWIELDRWGEVNKIIEKENDDDNIRNKMKEMLEEDSRIIIYLYYYLIF